MGNAGVPATITLRMPRPEASSRNENFARPRPRRWSSTGGIERALVFPGATVSLVLESVTLRAVERNGDPMHAL